jgi:ABC-type multidrug transport system fused ATPase/permease subunit
MAKIRISPVDQPDRISSYFKREWIVIALVTFFGLLFNGAMSAGPILQGRLIDTIASSGTSGDIAVQAVIFVAIILLIQIMRLLKRYFVRLFANRTGAVMRMMLYNSIMHRSLNELSEDRMGDLMTKAVSDVDICVEGMRKGTTEVFDTGILMISYLVTLFIYDWKITAMACIFIPVAMWLSEHLKKVIVKNSRSARAQYSYVADMTYEDIGNTVLLRVSGLMGRNREEYFKELDDLETKSIKAGILENSMQPLYNAIALFGIVTVLFFGAGNAINGTWTVGTFSAYIVIFTALAVKTGKAAKLFNSFQKAKVSWQRIKPYLTGYRHKDTADRKTGGDGRLAVSDLEFRYPDSEESVLRDISFEARPGDLIGVTGPIACGKTSLGIALQGLYPYIGSIILDGVELNEYSEYELGSRISYLGHQPQLFSDSIYRNITMGDDGDITAVLQDVCFEEDLKEMPDGINTVVGSNGVRLSGGQQARIALARTLYRHSILTILDDPFSAVDMKTEEAIIQNLRTHYSDRIIILISHRLSVFPKTDSIVYIHGDKSSEYGTHASLMASSESYASIYHLQTGGTANET